MYSYKLFLLQDGQFLTPEDVFSPPLLVAGYEMMINSVLLERSRSLLLVQDDIKAK